MLLSLRVRKKAGGAQGFLLSPPTPTGFLGYRTEPLIQVYWGVLDGQQLIRWEKISALQVDS